MGELSIINPNQGMSDRASSPSVNLGGLFVLEPFISPALYQKYPSAVDEWSLSTLMAADTASGGLNQLEDHYNTFIVSFSSLLSTVSYVFGRPNKTLPR